jgi:hypothetical protein
MADTAAHMIAKAFAVLWDEIFANTIGFCNDTE